MGVQYGADDENNVNAALVLFLEAIANLLKPRSVEWSMKRVVLKATFNSASYTVGTDGALWTRLGRSLRALLEVKKVQRNQSVSTDTKITAQEAAEMVGWLKQFPGDAEMLLNGNRVLISQDANQIFLSFAQVNRQYYDYIKNGKVAGDPFLSIRKRGP
ncbi:hypothetical protein BDV37DRAFT_282247 [Aspergillus pseudonomiae]|uniref:Uncharacterized protein n=1 Tax=Aspergillus pseudonomiae TaxID=1506151 RepID=A0A5N7DG52_9EURO|nr:uncharacterized protein BDV37DRAFT_282247 [Aspergillus pseudonomiae]KAE8405013.1 hypothetical protein BDV37DRAFT_282247 [Aspergillus pseudonomiae]